MACSDQGCYDYFLKALLVGDSGVGKSSILLRFVSDEFDDGQLATIGKMFQVSRVVVHYVHCGS